MAAEESFQWGILRFTDDLLAWELCEGLALLEEGGQAVQDHKSENSSNSKEAVSSPGKMQEERTAESRLPPPLWASERFTDELVAWELCEGLAQNQTKEEEATSSTECKNEEAQGNAEVPEDQKKETEEATSVEKETERIIEAREFHILRCTGLADEDPFGDNDPFVVVKKADGEVLHTTKAKEEAGSTAEWKNERFEFEESLEQETLTISVLDKDVASDDVLGTGWITVEACQEELLAKSEERREYRVKLVDEDDEDAGYCIVAVIIRVGTRVVEKIAEDAVDGEQEGQPEQAEKEEAEGTTDKVLARYLANEAAIITMQRVARGRSARNQTVQAKNQEAQLQQQVEDLDRKAYFLKRAWDALHHIQRCAKGAQERWRLHAWKSSEVQARFVPLDPFPVSAWISHVEGERTVSIQCDVLADPLSSRSNAIDQQHPAKHKRKQQQQQQHLGALIVPSVSIWTQTEPKSKKKLGTSGIGKSPSKLRSLVRSSNSMLGPYEDPEGEEDPYWHEHQGQSPSHSRISTTDNDIDWSNPHANSTNKSHSKRGKGPSPDVSINDLYAHTHRKLWKMSLEEIDELYRGAVTAKQRTEAEDERRRLKAMGLTSQISGGPKSKRSSQSATKNKSLLSSPTAYNNSNNSTVARLLPPIMDTTGPSSSAPVASKTVSPAVVERKEQRLRKDLTDVEEKEFGKLCFVIKRRKLKLLATQRQE